MAAFTSSGRPSISIWPPAIVTSVNCPQSSGIGSARRLWAVSQIVSHWGWSASAGNSIRPKPGASAAWAMLAASFRYQASVPPNPVRSNAATSASIMSCGIGASSRGVSGAREAGPNHPPLARMSAEIAGLPTALAEPSDSRC